MCLDPAFARFALAAGLASGIVSACTEVPPHHSPDEYCGDSFCLPDVSPAATGSCSTHDVLVHVIDSGIGRIRVIEDNFPGVDGLQKTPIAELPQVQAWHLSPTEPPAILVRVGADWPHFLVIVAEKRETKPEDLARLLQSLRLTMQPGQESNYGTGRARFPECP